MDEALWSWKIWFHKQMVQIVDELVFPQTKYKV